MLLEVETERVREELALEHKLECGRTRVRRSGPRVRLQVPRGSRQMRSIDVRGEV